MSRASRSRASISKQRGAEMSSRLMPAKPGAMALTISTMASESWVSRQIGHASMPAEALEEGRLALHDGQRGHRADVAQAQHGGAVRHDCDGVSLDGEAARVLGVLGDGHAHAGHARGVDHRQVVTVADGVLGRHLDLAAEVHEEGSVGDLAEADALDAAQLLDDLVRVRGGGRGDGDVDPELLVAGGGHVEAGDRAAGGLHGGGELGDRGSARGHFQTDRHRIRDAGRRCHGRVPLLSLVFAVHTGPGTPQVWQDLLSDRPTYPPVQGNQLQISEEHFHHTRYLRAVEWWVHTKQVRAPHGVEGADLVMHTFKTPTRHARLAASGRSKRRRLGPGAWIESVPSPG